MPVLLPTGVVDFVGDPLAGQQRENLILPLERGIPEPLARGVTGVTAAASSDAPRGDTRSTTGTLGPAVS